MDQMLGTYRLISPLGTGGMGEVWRAEDTKLLRHVAVKILPAQLAADPEWKQRFIHEARTVAQLSHPNIATIYGIHEEGEKLFIAMELIEGDSLTTILGKGPVSTKEAVRIADHVADALGHAHTHGIVHRDVKPDNIMVSPKHVKVLDFGIAKQIGGTADPSLTQGGMVMGTPHYMSPEQALGRTIDPRTDIFSLGVVLYEMLSGRKPFPGNTVTEIMLGIVMNEPRDIASAAPNLPPALIELIRRCMRKQPEERFASSDELRRALARVPLDEQPAARKSDPKIVAAPRMRALIADDDPATRYLLGGIMTKNHIAFDEVDNGADAVKKLKATQYALVFIDLFMPRVDGWGVLDYLRTHQSETRPRVIVVTGVQDQKLSAADRDVVSALVYKPIDIAAIESIVSS